MHSTQQLKRQLQTTSEEQTQHSGIHMHSCKKGSLTAKTGVEITHLGKQAYIFFEKRSDGDEAFEQK